MINISAQKFFLIAAVAAQFLHPLPAVAGKITLSWTPTVVFSEDQDNIVVRGAIEIGNSGDEGTLDVSPVFRLAGWEWAGEPKNIDANGKQSWTVEAVFPKSRLSCSADPGCAGLTLPEKGDFPLLLRITYHDLNHYQFSAVEVRSASIGTIDPNLKGLLRVPTILPLLIIDGEGEKFTGSVELNNISDNLHKAAVAVVSASEIVVGTPFHSVELAPHSITRTPFTLENFSGLVGNSYRAFAVVQWESQGYRVFVQAVKTVNLTKVSSAGTLFGLIWALSGFSAALILGAVFFHLRRPKPPKSQS